MANAAKDRGQELVAPSAVEGSTRPSGAHAPTSAAKRPLWKHVVFWGSAVVVGGGLAALRAPEWTLFVAVAVMACTLLPWFMLSGGRRG